MPFGLTFSFVCHAALLVWAFWSIRAVQELPAPETPVISAELITPSEFLKLKQGAEDAKKLETKAKEEPKPDDSKNDTKKPENAVAPLPPPPPPQDVAKLEPPPPAPEPPKTETPPPPPEPAPGPSPDEQKLLEQKIEEERLKAEAETKKKTEEEAKKKADAEAKKKAEEEAKKKKAAEDAAKKKKLAEEAKKKFDADKLANLINKAPDDAAPKALLDKDPTKKGQQAAGTSQAALETGKEAGTKSGADTVLSAREQDLLAGMIRSQLLRCSKMPGGGGGIDTPVVTVEWRVKQDGSVDGEPVVLNQQNTPLFRIAAEASVNAVRNCSPLNLPPDKFAAWSKITWDFDWPQILGLR